MLIAKMTSHIAINFSLLVLVTLPFFSSGLSLPKIFGNGMVLQAEPSRAQVWGSFDGAGEVRLTLQCQSGASYDYVAQSVSALQKYSIIWALTRKLDHEYFKVFFY
jgi:hypothetical protein